MFTDLALASLYYGQEFLNWKGARNVFGCALNFDLSYLVHAQATSGGGSMVGLQHYVVVVCFLLFLSPIIGATEPPFGNEAVERCPAEQGSLSNSDRLLIFGVVQMNTSARRRKDCVLDIFVEIGENTWKQQLNSNSFAFQVPVRSFGGMIGMISIHEHGGKWQRLWNHFFVVQDIGVQRFNAMLSGNCTRIENPGSALITWSPGMCPSLLVEKTGSLLFFTSLPTDVIRMCPLVPFSYVDNICIISGALEIYPTTTYERKAYFGMAFLEILMIYIDDHLRNYGESSDWHRVFGVYFLRTWHLHCLGIVFLFLHTVNWFLRILENVSAIALSNLDLSWPVTADECPHILLDREPQTSCPSSDTSFAGLTSQANLQSRDSSLAPSGDILCQDSWGDAHQYLHKLMDFPVDGSGYYYNCTAQRRSLSDLLLQSGRWSRDSNGRLIRDRPY